MPSARGNDAALRAHPWLKWLGTQRDLYESQSGADHAAVRARLGATFTVAEAIADPLTAAWHKRRGAGAETMANVNNKFQGITRHTPKRSALAMARMPFESAFAERLVASTPPYPAGGASGARLFRPGSRGIVFSGGAKHVQLVSRTAELLCRTAAASGVKPLPIELWHNSEIKDSVCASLWKHNGVACRNLHDFVPFMDTSTGGSSVGQHFQNKVAALVLSSFEQVLMIDADSVPQKDPRHLFDAAQFKETGQLFWSDFWGSHTNGFSTTSKAAGSWAFVGVQPYPGQEQESGQLLVDKSRVWRELNLALHLNLRDYMTRNKDFGDLVYGDKDLFRLSWLFLRTPFFMSSQPVWLGRYHKNHRVSQKPGDKPPFCLRSIGQIDTDKDNAAVLFVHQPRRMRMPVSKLALYDFTCATSHVGYTKDTCRAGAESVDKCVKPFPPRRAQDRPDYVGWLLHTCECEGGRSAIAKCTVKPWSGGQNFAHPLYEYA
jgi:hypothetical protein